VVGSINHTGLALALNVYGPADIPSLPGVTMRGRGLPEGVRRGPTVGWERCRFLGASGVGPESSLRDFDRELALFMHKTQAPLRSGGAENLHPTPDGLPPAPVENLPLPRLSVLLPALDEEGGVRHVLEGIPWSSLSRMGFRLDVNLLDGHSLDRTRGLAVRTGSLRPDSGFAGNLYALSGPAVHSQNGFQRDSHSLRMAVSRSWRGHAFWQ